MSDKGRISDNYDIPGYIHRPGVHCISSALRNALEYCGLKLSEEMVFGLGCTMNLSYMNMPGMDPMLGGRGRDLEETLCKNLGIKLNKFTTKDAEKGWNRLKEHLQAGLPMAINLDMHYLTYRNLPPDFHFGSHGVVICGYNKERQLVSVSDTEYTEIQEITVQELMKGRNSKHNRWLDPNNLIYEMTDINQEIDIKSILPRAINTVGKNLTKKSNFFMRKMGIYNGLSAIDAFIQDLEKWKKLIDDKLKSRLIELAGYISDYGTGGGSFRYLYSRFLKEAAILLDKNSLLSLSEFYNELGDHWEEVSKLINEFANNIETQDKPEFYKNLKKKIFVIKELESEGAQKLILFK